MWRRSGSPNVAHQPSARQLSSRKHTKPSRRVGRELLLVLAGLAAMVAGASLLVEGVRGLAQADDTQARLSLTVVGFATAFELVVLAWSATRRGISDAVVAAVVGSFAYNATMTLGAAALVRPLRIADAGPIRLPAVVMLVALALPILLAQRTGGSHDAPAYCCSPPTRRSSSSP